MSLSLSPLCGELVYFCSNSFPTICAAASNHSSSQPMVLKYLNFQKRCRTSSNINYILIQDDWNNLCTHCNMIHLHLLSSRVIIVEHFLSKTKCSTDRWLIFRINRLRGKSIDDMVHGHIGCSKRWCGARKKQCCIFEDLGCWISYWTSVLK